MKTVGDTINLTLCLVKSLFGLNWPKLQLAFKVQIYATLYPDNMER